jgi:RHS repeat-associated protein
LSGPQIDQVFNQEGGNSHWLLGDHLGTTRDVVDDSGALVRHYVFDSYGNLEGSVAETKVLFAGRELDSLTGLYYVRARWYDPAVGRWASEDPSGLGPDTNPYRYVANSPVNYTDPSGLVGENWIIETVGGQIVKIVVPYVGEFVGATAVEDAVAAVAPELEAYENLQLARILEEAEARGAKYAADTAAKQGGRGCLSTVARGGAYTVIAVEVVVVAAEVTLIIYYNVETNNLRSEFLELAEECYTNQGHDAATAAQKAQKELEALDQQEPGWWSEYGDFFYDDYIKWWWPW